VSTEWYEGLFAGLACVCVGGLITFLWMLYRMPSEGEGYRFGGPNAPEPDPLESLWQMPSKPEGVDRVTSKVRAHDAPAAQAESR
jgi:hypothetical protein